MKKGIAYIICIKALWMLNNKVKLFYLVNLCVSGCLTNVALLLSTFPDVKKNIK